MMMPGESVCDDYSKIFILCHLIQFGGIEVYSRGGGKELNLFLKICIVQHLLSLKSRYLESKNDEMALISSCNIA